MTSSYAQTIGEKIRSSGAIVPIGSTVVLMIFVSGILWVMDNYSSYVAVLEMDVNTIRDAASVASDQTQTGWFGKLIIGASFLAKAFVPQGLATIMFSVFLLMKAESPVEHVYKWASLVVGSLAWIYDGWTGYVFYLHPSVAGMTLATGWAIPETQHFFRDALINAVIYDALGSEFLLSICVGIFSIIAADYMEQARKLRDALNGVPLRLPSRGGQRDPRDAPQRSRTARESGHRPTESRPASSSERTPVTVRREVGRGARQRVRSGIR